MESRILPAAEYGRLAGTELELAIRCMPPDTRVVVVEDAGAIVGCWALTSYRHVEGLYVDPAHQKRAAVQRHLYTRMSKEVAALGDCVVLTSAVTQNVADLIEHAGGQQLPGLHFVLPMGGRT